MRIVIDLDGVSYHFVRTAVYMLHAYRGCAIVEVDVSQWYPWPNVSDEDWKWLWTEGVRLGLFRYGHLVRGAVEGVRALSDAGHELIVATHRRKEAIPDTLEWVAYQRLPFSEVHILSNGQPKSTVQGDVLIDDKPENVAEWIEHDGRTAVLFNQPWNRHYPQSRRVRIGYGWKNTVEVVANIRNLMAGAA